MSAYNSFTLAMCAPHPAPVSIQPRRTGDREISSLHSHWWREERTKKANPECSPFRGETRFPRARRQGADSSGIARQILSARSFAFIANPISRSRRTDLPPPLPFPKNKNHPACTGHDRDERPTASSLIVPLA